jgi:sugar/nucleoside kinase (ribokinase family)
MTPPARVRAVVWGPAYCDLVFGGLDRLPELGQERFARTFRVAPGGSAITAIALHRLGHAVELVADVGRDALAGWLRDALIREGVGIDALRAVQEVTPVTAALSTAADRAFVTYLEPPGPPPDLAELLRATGATHLHVAGFPAALAEPGLVDTAHAQGATVSFDPGWDGHALADPRVRRVALAADVLLPNRLEAGLLLAEDGDGGAPPMAQAALARLSALRPGRVTVVKDGAAGAWGNDARQRAAGSVADAPAWVAAPRVDAVDATGAGDVFDAGFLDAWWAGEPLEACLRRAAWCGARATTAYGGATAAPTREQLHALWCDEQGGTT